MLTRNKTRANCLFRLLLAHPKGLPASELSVKLFEDDPYIRVSSRRRLLRNAVRLLKIGLSAFVDEHERCSYRLDSATRVANQPGRFPRAHGNELFYKLTKK